METPDNTEAKENQNGSFTNNRDTSTYILSEIEGALAKNLKAINEQNEMVLSAFEKMKAHYKPSAIDGKKWGEHVALSMGYELANRQKETLYNAMVAIVAENGAYSDIDDFMRYYSGLTERQMKHHPREHRIIYQALREYRQYL